MSDSFNYVNIIGDGFEGCINLFFGESCIAMIDNVQLAESIKNVTPKRSRAVKVDPRIVAAYIHHKGKWPGDIESGIVYCDGLRVTIDDFLMLKNTGLF